MSNFSDMHRSWLLASNAPAVQSRVISEEERQALLDLNARVYRNTVYPMPMTAGVYEAAFDNFWATTSIPLRSDVVAGIPSAPYRNLLDVVDEKWFYLGSNAPERRQVTLIGRHSLADVDADTLVGEMRRRLDMTREFEVASDQFAPGRVGPGLACGRWLQSYAILNWPFNHAGGQYSYGLYAMSQHFMLPSISTIIRVATRGKDVQDPLDVHQLTPSVTRGIPMSSDLNVFSPRLPEFRSDIPDDVIARILSHFVNPTSPLATMARSIKLVSRQWYRCWWKAALGSSSPTKLWFGNATQAYFGASLYRQVADSSAKEFGLARLLDAMTTSFSQRASPTKTPKSLSPKDKVKSVLRRAKVGGGCAAAAAAASAAFDYLVIDGAKITSLDLSGQYAHDALLRVVETRFPNLVHLKWDRSRGLDDVRLANLLRWLPSLRTLSVAFAADLRTVNNVAAAIPRQLEELNVAGCCFGAPGLLALARACPAVRRLDISGLDYAHPRGKVNSQGIPFRTFYESAGHETIELCGQNFPELEVLMAAELYAPTLRAVPITFGVNAATKLRALDLSISPGVHLRYELMNDIGKLRALEVLHLNGVQFDDKTSGDIGGTTLSSLPKLRYLGISSEWGGSSLALVLKHLLESSPRHAPLTIMQLTYHPQVCRRPIDSIRHLVWPTALSADDVFRYLQPDEELPAGSRSLVVRAAACRHMLTSFESAQQLYHETQSVALRTQSHPGSAYQRMLLLSEYTNSNMIRHEAKNIRTLDYWPTAATTTTIPSY